MVCVKIATPWLRVRIDARTGDVCVALLRNGAASETRVEGCDLREPHLDVDVRTWNRKPSATTCVQCCSTCALLESTVVCVADPRLEEEGQKRLYRTYSDTGTNQ